MPNDSSTHVFDTRGFEDWVRGKRQRRRHRIALAACGVLAVSCAAWIIWVVFSPAATISSSDSRPTAVSSAPDSDPEAGRDRAGSRTIPFTTAPLHQEANSDHQQRLRVDSTAFEKVYRAAKAIHASTLVGVSHMRFSELLQELATELSIVRDRVLNEDERALFRMYSRVLEAYYDSNVLWARKIEASDEIWGGQIPFFDAKDEVSIIATRYNLSSTERRLEFTERRWSALSPTTIQALWSIASAALDEATVAYQRD